MSADRPHVSVIVNSHREGRLAHRSVRSAQLCLEHAAEQGIRCELLAILDRPDAATVEYFPEKRAQFTVVEQTDFGDPGLARNVCCGGDLDKLAHELSSLWYDPERRDDTGERARKHVATHHDPVGCVEQLADVLKWAAAENRSKAAGIQNGATRTYLTI